MAQKTDGMLQNVHSAAGIVLHSVFPVGVITRCLRQIQGWKGLELHLCAVRHIAAHIMVIFQTESRCTFPAQSILLNFKIPPSVGWSARGCSVLWVCVILHCRWGFPPGVMQVRLYGKMLSMNDFVSPHGCQFHMENWQPASSCSTGIGSNPPHPPFPDPANVKRSRDSRCVFCFVYLKTWILLADASMTKS